MKGFTIFLSSLVLAAEVVYARDVPQNVRDFYNRVKGKKSCANVLKTGFYDTDVGSNNFGYCQDPNSKVIYLHGSNNELANMDVDCDGKQGDNDSDGQSALSTDTQSKTAFKNILRHYKVGVKEFNANVHPYVVFGNDGTNPSFKPQNYGIQPLSIIAVVCGDKIVYGIWGDTNGNDRTPLFGEASISLATACYGADNINGDQGHDAEDVLYLAFPGVNAVPGKLGANWAAKSYDEFENSIQALGDHLIAGI